MSSDESVTNEEVAERMTEEEIDEEICDIQNQLTDIDILNYVTFDGTNYEEGKGIVEIWLDDLKDNIYEIFSRSSIFWNVDM